MATLYAFALVAIFNPLGHIVSSIFIGTICSMELLAVFIVLFSTRFLKLQQRRSIAARVSIINVINDYSYLYIDYWKTKRAVVNMVAAESGMTILDSTGSLGTL